MPLIERRPFTETEENATLVLLDPLLFALAFWGDELTIPKNRIDLPEHWLGQQVISKEQRMMCLAGADYMLLRDMSPRLAAGSAKKVAYRTSRKVAKTLFMEARMIQIPLTCTSKSPLEGMIHTPGERQMSPLQDRYKKKLNQIRLFRLMWKGSSESTGVDNWKTNFTWHWRIEGQEARAGYAMIGLRASVLLGDEADYANERAYLEREQTALPGCYQWWGGVPRGVRGVFWSECRNPNSGWDVYRVDMRANPIYHSDTAWAEQVKGEWNSQRVQTQVLGRDGEVAVSSFPVIPVNTELPFLLREFSAVDYELHRDDLVSLMNVPVHAVSDAEAWMIYLDYGYSPSPTELGVAYYRKGVWFTLARIEMRQIDPTRTAELVNVLDQRILPRPAALIMVDGHGQGAGVLSALYSEERYAGYQYSDRAIDVGFASTAKLAGILVHKKCGSRAHTEGDARRWRCDVCDEAIYDMSELREATLQMKHWLSISLKDALSEGQKWLDNQVWPGGVAVVLGYDSATIDELTGTTEVQRPGGNVIFYPPMEGEDHRTDSLRCLISGALRWSQIQTQAPATALAELGWMGVVGEDAGHSAWNAPWS